MFKQKLVFLLRNQNFNFYDTSKTVIIIMGKKGETKAGKKDLCEQFCNSESKII